MKNKREALSWEVKMLKLERTSITMSAEGFKAFVEELDKPAKPVPQLMELLKRKAPWEKT
jgi:uncharacterized protein (DUF1778 family)